MFVFQQTVFPCQVAKVAGAVEKFGGGNAFGDFKRYFSVRDGYFSR
jgi:hypothetical protein